MTLGRLITAASVLLALTALAQEPSPAAIRKFHERSETLRQGEIARLEHRLRGLASGAATSRSKGREIAQISSDLKALRSGQRTVVPSIDFPPEVGAIGRLPGLGGHVERVAASGEGASGDVLVTCYFPLQVVTVRNFQPVASKISRPVLLRLQGVDTRELRVGMDVPLPQTFVIVARDDSTTPGGDVFTARPFDPLTAASK